MYYPYLRGKQFELILLRDNAKFIADNNFHPIIEPVKEDFKALNKAIESLCLYGVEFTLIINPQVGSNPILLSEISKLFDGLTPMGFSNCVSIGYVLTPTTDFIELENTVKNFSKFTFTLIHNGYTDGVNLSKIIEDMDNISRHIFIEGKAGKLYQRNFCKNGIERILIRDGFKSQIKNSLYPKTEHFSDLHITYVDERMDAFGDYLIVGEDYSESGGPAYSIAIHLTYLDEQKDMYIFHFVSDRTDSPTDPGGKFLEALTKLYKETIKPNSKIFKTSAVQAYLELYQKGHYPGLGSAKKLSMQHHIELMAEYLKNPV
ncbi:MAG: sce7725 family protein [Bacteroidales bacterium]|nr:sce7725 family protein [Bacteroidales bacterium]